MAVFFQHALDHIVNGVIQFQIQYLPHLIDHKPVQILALVFRQLHFLDSAGGAIHHNARPLAFDACAVQSSANLGGQLGRICQQPFMINAFRRLSSHSMTHPQTALFIDALCQKH